MDLEFGQNNMDEVRTGVAYAICIHRSVLTNVVNVDYAKLDKPYARLLARALAAKTLADIIAVIDDAERETEQYIHMRKGVWLSVVTGQPI